MHATRIPDFTNKTPEGMSIWFTEMSLRGLLFHPEEDAASIRTTATGEKTFTAEECRKLNSIMSQMFALFGEGVCDVCYPIFMQTAGFRLAA
jgi:hypothetical protein